jgi:hypothetical protein
VTNYPRIRWNQVPAGYVPLVAGQCHQYQSSHNLLSSTQARGDSSAPRRMTVWAKKLAEAKTLADEVGGSEYPEFYRRSRAEPLAGLFGSINPVYRGRPKRMALHLLGAAAGPFWSGACWQYHSAGLMYRDASVLGIKRSKCRTTLAGLALLDFWAVNFPNFKRFVDAFATKKARDEIAAACFDFEFGILPQDIKRQLGINEEIKTQKAFVDNFIYELKARNVKRRIAKPYGYYGKEYLSGLYQVDYLSTITNTTSANVFQNPTPTNTQTTLIAPKPTGISGDTHDAIKDFISKLPTEERIKKILTRICLKEAEQEF